MTTPENLLERPPRRYRATTLFCDIRGFSALFDQRDPMEALAFVNSVLGTLGQVVERCGGTIDKFTGDGFLAHFGVANESTTHVEDACRCAILLREHLARLNVQRHAGDQRVVSIGIGIHSGDVAGGVVRASFKAEFSVFGTVVNTAARIEALTKDFGVDCLVSETIYAEVRDTFAFKEMPHRPLKGIRASQLTYWLLPTNLVKGV